MNTKALFIHRSVGRNLIRDGRLRELLRESRPNIELSDFDQNAGGLTGPHGETETLTPNLPGENANPENYAALFSDECPPANRPFLAKVLDYKLIIIKSCYPNSNLASDQEVETVKDYYRQIAGFFGRQPDKQLIILTSPPLVPLRTDAAEAARARRLATWLVAADLGANVRVFNLFDLLAAPENQPQANTLRRDNRRFWPFDSHPNAQASQRAAPALAKFIDQTVTQT